MTREFSYLLRTLKRVPVIPLIACGLFVLAGLAFLPLLGIESDEALFAIVFFKPQGGGYVYRIAHAELPLMILSYLGTLKSWIYRPIFKIFGMGVWSTRVPVILAGAATVWLLYRILLKISGRRAALIGCSLLATDAAYLLTSTFDWGPVALEHLLLLGATLLLIRFWEHRQEAALAAAFFLFGLALWNKALALWMLSGIGLAAVVTIPRQILDVATPRRVGLAALCLCLGALPLILYNIRPLWLHGAGGLADAPAASAARVAAKGVRRLIGSGRASPAQPARLRLLCRPSADAPGPRAGSAHTRVCAPGHDRGLARDGADCQQWQ